MPLAEALEVRRTVRRFASRPLDLAQVSQLLWSAGGTSDPRGLRTAPSAGATYPLDLYLVVGERGVKDLPAGIYHYRVEAHALAPVAPGDARAAVARASLHQSWMAEAPVMVVITGEYRRCTARYGERGVRYTHMEVRERQPEPVPGGRGPGPGGRDRRGLRGQGRGPGRETASGP